MYISFVPSALMKYTFFHFTHEISHIHSKHMNILYILSCICMLCIPIRIALYLSSANRKEGYDHESIQLPNTFRSKTPKGKNITKTCLYNIDPLKPHFYIVKLGFTGVYIIFLISAQNIDCGYSLEPPRRGGSNEYPQSMFWPEVWEISEFLSETFHFLVVEMFSIFA